VVFPQSQVITQFENKVFANIKDYPSGIIFLAAVSGGADSMAMLTALCAVLEKDQLFCIHINHNLRSAEETKNDGELVLNFCKEQGIKCCIETIPPGKITAFAKKKGTGIEAAARFFRRRAFFKEAARLGDNTFILTAHTKDDLLEQSLMRILRGAGPAGLAVMPVRNKRLIRPLLSISRAEIINYLNNKNIPWREDSSNTDEKFLRNRIRRRLVPLLNESFPSWKTGLSAMAETQALAAEFIIEEAGRLIKWNKNKPQSFTEGGNSEDFLSANAQDFFAQPLIIREESLFLAVDELLKGTKNSRTVKRSSIRRFCAGAKTADLGPVQVKQKDGNILLLHSKKDFFECGVSRLIK